MNIWIREQTENKMIIDITSWKSCYTLTYKKFRDGSILFSKRVQTKVRLFKFK